MPEAEDARTRDHPSRRAPAHHPQAAGLAHDRSRRGGALPRALGSRALSRPSRTRDIAARLPSQRPGDLRAHSRRQSDTCSTRGERGRTSVCTWASRFARCPSRAGVGWPISIDPQNPKRRVAGPGRGEREALTRYRSGRAHAGATLLRLMAADGPDAPTSRARGQARRPLFGDHPVRRRAPQSAARGQRRHGAPRDASLRPSELPVASAAPGSAQRSSRRRRDPT